jgi:hypothetical protein
MPAARFMSVPSKRMASSVTIIEFLTGMARNFPNTMTAVSLIGGLAVGQLPWVIMGAGGIVVALLVLCAQAVTGSLFASTKTPDIAILQACSLIPITPPGSTYYFVPSLWFAMTAYYVTYILLNASEVYSEPATKLPQEALPVQHRKSIGVVSMVAVLLLFVSLAIFRFRTGCEYSWHLGPISLPIGSILGIILGATLAYVLRFGTSSKRDPSVGDVHGVMIGLQPGSLRTHPLACAPRSSSSSSA